MLFGKKEVQDKTLRHAEQIAKEQNFKIIFASMVGSISRGLQVVDSDYDTRFLFIKNDFPHKIYDPEECEEKDIIFRYYYKNDHGADIPISELYDRIPFWEITSCLHYLVKQNINHGKGAWNSSGLYFSVLHTLFSPYAWDPYGLQEKLRPLVDLLFNKKVLLKYYAAYIKNYYRPTREVKIKDYRDSIWGALSIQWILQHNQSAPIPINSMLAVMDDKILRKEIESLCFECYEKTKEYFTSINGQERAITRLKGVLTPAVKKLDDFIQDMINKANMVVEDDSTSPNESLQKNREILNEMYMIIYKSMNEPIIYGVND